MKGYLVFCFQTNHKSSKYFFRLLTPTKKIVDGAPQSFYPLYLRIIKLF